MVWFKSRRSDDNTNTINISGGANHGSTEITLLTSAIDKLYESIKELTKYVNKLEKRIDKLELRMEQIKHV